MLSGHSGGPLLNRRGEVVGWSVRSGFDKVVNGEGYYAAGLNEVRPMPPPLPVMMTPRMMIDEILMMPFIRDELMRS